MRISVLGCGWLGLPLAGALASDGHVVRGSTTTPAKLDAIRDAGAAPHVIRLSPEPKGQLEGFFDADCMIVTLPPTGGDEAYIQRLTALLNAARQGAVQWFVFTSSTSVYAKRDAVVDENDTSPPASERGKTMREAEALFLLPPFDATVLRLGGLYGPDRDPARSLAGKTGVAGPDAPVNLVHRDDAIGVVREVLAQEVRNGIFNVVADAHPTKQAYYTARAEALGLPPPRFAAGPVPWKQVSSRKVREVLGYAFRHEPTV